MSTSGQNIYIVWQNFLSPVDQNILCKASNDNKTTFGKTIKINNTTGGEIPKLTAQGDSVYIA